MTEGKIMVEREPYEKDGKTYQSYFIKGTVRGVDFRVRIVPPDYGGYTVLDIVYAGEQEAELVLVPYEITDEKTGRVTKGNSYAVHSEDEDGTVYECKIIPFRKSDKDLLQMLLNKKAEQKDRKGIAVRHVPDRSFLFSRIKWR